MEGPRRATFAGRTEGEGEITPSICLAIAGQQAQPLSAPPARTTGGPIVDGNIFNSEGIHVAVVRDSAIYDLRGVKLYELKGTNLYKLSGELVGHLPTARGSRNRLDKSTDKFFPRK